MSDILERWRRLEASMDAVRATRACREAVRALEIIRGLGPEEVRNVADAAIQRVEAELESDLADLAGGEADQ